jgi:hypothetical protein
MNPVDVASLMVDHTLPHNSVIPLAPHPAAKNDPYVTQGMSGVNLFDTFEEEHIMETPSLPRYNTRATARQKSANQAQFLAPRVFRPLIHKYPGFSCTPKEYHLSYSYDQCCNK